MSPAREKNPRKPGLTRPADVAQNAPWPRYSWAVQHLMILTDEIIDRAIESLGPADLAGGKQGDGRILYDGASRRIAKATAALTHDKRPIPDRTVRHRLAKAQERGRYEYTGDLHPNHPRGRVLYLRPFKKTLEAIRTNPEYAITPRGNFFTCGKARRICTREEMTRWGADLKQDEPAGVPMQQLTQPIDIGAAVATAPRQPRKKATTPEETIEVILDALNDSTHGATPKDAEGLYNAVLQQSGNHPPPAETIADFVRAIAQTQTRPGTPPRPISLHTVKRELNRRVEKWRRQQRKQRRNEAFERDARINSIAERLREYERQDLPPPERELIGEWLATFSPDEVDAARKLLKN